MWPVHRFERRYNAALTIFTAAYTFSVLTPSEQARVDDKVYENLSGALIGGSGSSDRNLSGIKWKDLLID